MLRLYLYARVRFFSRTIAHETAGAASTRHSLRPPDFSGAKDEQDSGETRRENADPYSLVITRLDRVIQYSRGRHD